MKRKITVEVEVSEGRYCLHCLFRVYDEEPWCALFETELKTEEWPRLNGPGQLVQPLRCPECLKATGDE